MEQIQKNTKEIIIHSPQELPDFSQIEHIEEPWMKVDIITPSEFLGLIMQLCQEKRGIYKNTEYLSDRVILHYEIPLTSLLTDFYDKLKSISKGYASLNYDFIEYRFCEVTKLNILIADEIVEALTTIIYKDEIYKASRKIVESLKNTIPRQMFEVKIQAAVGGKIVASERIQAFRKDVIAKLYGGDVTRKRKLLEKQKKGKKKMKIRGKIDIPPEAFIAALKK
jgi:GTP-binding protein LepA